MLIVTAEISIGRPLAASLGLESGKLWDYCGMLRGAPRSPQSEVDRAHGRQFTKVRSVPFAPGSGADSRR